MNDAEGHNEPGPRVRPDGPTVTAASPSRADFPEARIDRYQILDQLGEGGMGVVYLAEQTEPVRRRVALKVIKLGMDTRQVIARFEAERQALALMDHPHIAHVLDAGATESGRPYFVMELVRGRPITEYCDANRLDLRRRLELFLPVCRAIQHAHHKGIIHRDIKPSNVLVRMRDGEPVPMVIDFGIAKATHQPLSEGALVTQVEQLVGTPTHMSPEQAERGGIDVDTRTDVYALGVLLYELLAGRPPFEPQRLRTAGFDEAARIIRDEPARRPSTWLGDAGDDAGRLAERCGSTPAALARAVRGDLDWIVMKAIEKDRTRRYDTPLELAADVSRHLRGEPVLAGPPSVRYRLGKHFKRHRVSITLGAAAVAVLAAAFVVTAVKWRDAVAARRAEVEQRLIAEEATRQAEQALAEAETQRAAAQAEASQNAAVVGFLQRMLALANPTGPSDITAPTSEGRTAPLQRELAPLELTLAQVLQHAGRHVVPSVAHEPKVDGAVRYILGTTFADVGLDFQAEHHLYTAYRLLRRELGDEHPDTLRAMAKLGQRLRHAFHAQFLLHEASDGMVRILGPDHPEALVARSWYGERLLQTTRWHPRALAVLEDTLTRQQVAVGPQHPQTLWTKRLTAEALWLNGRGDDAMRLGAETLLQAERAGLPYITANLNLGFAIAKVQGGGDQTDPAEVLNHVRTALAEAEVAFGSQSYHYVRAVVDGAEALEAAGLADGAAALYRENIRAWALGSSGTDDRLPEWHRNLERLLERRGQDPSEVRTQRLALLEALAERGGAEAANAWRTEGYIREQSGRHDAAGEAYERALGLSLALWPDEDRLETAWALQGLANARWAAGDFESAEQLFRESLDLRTRLYGPDATETLILLQSLPKLLAEMGRADEALSVAQRLRDGIAPRREFCAPQYAVALQVLAMIQVDLGLIDEADATSAHMLEFADEHLSTWRGFSVAARGVRGAVDARLGDYAAAESPLVAANFAYAWSSSLDPLQRGDYHWFIRQTAELFRRWAEADPTPERRKEALRWTEIEASVIDATEKTGGVTRRPTRS